MKKILFVLPTDSSKGGAESVLRLIARELSKDQEIRIDILFSTKNVYHGWDNLRSRHNVSLRFSRPKSVWFGIPRLFLNLICLRKQKFDICFTSHTDMTGIVGFLRRLHLLSIDKFVARESCSVFLRYRKLPLRFKIHHKLGYPAIDLLICQTQEMKKQFMERASQLTREIGRIEVLPNPIDLEQIKEEIQKPVETNFSSSYRYIVAAGRLISIKGFEQLIKAFSILHKESAFEDTRLVILGEGDRRNYLENLVKELHLESLVELRGNVENVYPYFHQAELCVISSLLEGFPNVLLQMISQCNRVVSTRCAGGIESLDGIITCPPNQEDALYRAIKEGLVLKDNINRDLFNQELNRRAAPIFVQKIHTLIEE